jgi:hypothetical protein
MPEVYSHFNSLWIRFWARGTTGWGILRKVTNLRLNPVIKERDSSITIRNCVRFALKCKRDDPNLDTIFRNQWPPGISLTDTAIIHCIGAHHIISIHNIFKWASSIACVIVYILKSGDLEVVGRLSLKLCQTPSEGLKLVTNRK